MKRTGLMMVLALAGQLAGQPAGGRSALETFYQPLGDADGRRIAYRVRPGETLFTIAQRLLGDPYRARLLAEINKVEDPMRLEEGRTLSVPVPAMGILYSLQRAADCDLVEVNERYAFRAGDRFRLRLTTNIEGYLYVFNRRPDGRITRLSDGAGQKVKAFADYTLPSAGGRDEWFRLDAEQGAEEILVLVSPLRLTALDSDLAAGEARQALERLMARGRSTDAALGESAGGQSRSLVIASPVDETLVLAHRIVLKKQ